MSDTLGTNNELLSSKEAGKLLGYTHDYISKLCREGKMNGSQKGRAWYVSKEEVFDFKKRHEAELAQKKAELSQKFSEIRSKHESKRVDNKEESVSVSENHKEEVVDKVFNEPVISPVKTVNSRQFVAAGVLAALLIAPSVLSSITKPSQSTANVSIVAQESRADNFVDTFDKGVATVIYNQSALVAQTASTFNFVQYLKDGYWELAVNFGRLSQGFYSFLSNITTGWFTFYLMQGQMIYASIVQTHDMGATVLKGYELLGKSFVVGGKNVIESYGEMLNLDSKAESAKKKLNNFVFNTKEGYVYAKEQTNHTFKDVLFSGITNTFRTITGNIQGNTSQMANLVSEVSHTVTGSVINIFSFEFMKQKEGVVKVNLDN